MIKLDQVILPVNYTDQDIILNICKNLKIKRNEILNYEILKLAIDARKKPNIIISQMYVLESVMKFVKRILIFHLLNYQVLFYKV